MKRNCTECGAAVNPARVAIGYNVCLPCGERLARQRVHTIAPLHKSIVHPNHRPPRPNGHKQQRRLYR